MTFNFFPNNTPTYRDKRLKGFWPILGGLFNFYLVCQAVTPAQLLLVDFRYRGDKLVLGITQQVQHLAQI